MTPLSPQNALKLSAWIASQHPELFRVLVAKVNALQRTPLGRLGYFGDDTELEFTPDLPAYQITPDINLDSSAAYSPELSDVSFNIDAAIGGSDTADYGFTDSITSAIAAPTKAISTDPPSAGGFWSSLSSGASGVASAIGKVASALVSPGSIAAVGGAAAAYFSMQGKTQVAQTQAAQQNAVLQAQLARAAAGAAPATISYVTDPYTGAQVPVYNTATGQVPVTGSLLNQLAAPQTAGTVAGIPTPWALAGAGLLLVVIFFSGRKTS